MPLSPLDRAVIHEYIVPTRITADLQNSAFLTNRALAGAAYPINGGACGNFVFDYIAYVTGKMIDNANNLIVSDGAFHPVDVALTRIFNYAELSHAQTGTPCVVSVPNYTGTPPILSEHRPIHYFILYRDEPLCYAYGLNHSGCLMVGNRGHIDNDSVRRIKATDFAGGNFAYTDGLTHILHSIDITLIPLPVPAPAPDDGCCSVM